MPFATFSTENQIKQKMDSLRVTASVLSALCDGISQTKLSQALSGFRPLTNPEGIRVLECLGQLEQIARACSPVPVSFQNPTIIKHLIKALADGEVLITVRQHSDEANAKGAGQAVLGEQAGDAKPDHATHE
jgi:hypothetical protein